MSSVANQNHPKIVTFFLQTFEFADSFNDLYIFRMLNDLFIEIYEEKKQQ